MQGGDEEAVARHAALLHQAAEARWGAERRQSLATSLRRAAEALAVLDTLPRTFADEPFPTGPGTTPSPPLP